MIKENLMKPNRAQLFFITIIVAIAAPQLASAYAGPGAGLTVIGAALAFIGAVFLAIVGFLWYWSLANFVNRPN